MSRLLVLIACLLLSVVANAAVLEMRVAHPTRNTDGSLIPVSGSAALAFTRFEYGTCRGQKFGKLKGWQVLPTEITATRFTNVRRETVCTRAYWFNNAAAMSGPSAVVKVRP